MPDTPLIKIPVLITERLVLRALDDSDAEEILALRSDPEVLRYIDIQKANDLEDARNFIHKINANAETSNGMLWAIARKEDARLIGTICYWNMKPAIHQAEIGYMLHPFFQGQGYMQEAVRRIIPFGKDMLDLKTILADIHPENEKSIQLMEKFGFLLANRTAEAVMYSLALSD